MAKIAWKSFPYPAGDYDYSGAALQKRWSRLHQGDCEPYPAAAYLKKLVSTHPDLKLTMSVEQAAKTLQAAWHSYHCGDFGQAIGLGLSVGPLGYNVANKAAIIYATYLESAEKRKLALFLESVERAEELQAYAATMPNAWYLHAQALGRYSQAISVVKALTQGFGGKVKASLDRAIALEPRHADAHIGLGAYHAEVIDKIGALIGGLTYGASTASGVKHFELALKLNPLSAIARIEYANGLMMMFGDSKIAKATRLYEDAAKCVAADATERLDIELAHSELKE